MSDPSAHWICIVGGGRSQVPFIEAATERGLSTVVFDVDPDAPAKRVATEFVAMSTHDTAGVIAHLEEHRRHLVGCFTYSSYEGALITTTAVVDHFGVRGLSPDAFAGTSSKVEMRRRLASAGLPVPAGERITDPTRLEEFRSRHGRVMVKPARGSVGSQGVAVLDPDASDGVAVLRLACEISSDGLAVVESFLDGAEYSVDGFVIDGEACVLATSRKYSGGPEAHFVIAGYVTGDGAVAPESQTELESLAAATVAALAVDNSYFSLDVLAADGDFFVIDAGPLLDAKVDRLLHHAGVDVYGIAADIALGGSVTAATLGTGCHALRFVYAGRVGILQSATPGLFTHGGSEVEMVLEMEKKVGDSVGPPQSVSDVLGWVCASGSDAGRLWTALEEVGLVGRIEVGDPA